MIHNPIPSENELLECFDDNGITIEPKLRSILHIKPYTIWHGVSDIWIVNNIGQILCSKRSEMVSGNPGKWQTYFGGHVQARSSFEETALHELEEEVGLTIVSKDLHLIEWGKALEYMHIYYKYVYFFDGLAQKLTFPDGEITEVAWYSFNDYWRDQTNNLNKWCNGMRPEQYKIIKDKMKPFPSYVGML